MRRHELPEDIALESPREALRPAAATVLGEEGVLDCEALPDGVERPVVAVELVELELVLQGLEQHAQLGTHHDRQMTGPTRVAGSRLAGAGDRRAGAEELARRLQPRAVGEDTAPVELGVVEGVGGVGGRGEDPTPAARRNVNHGRVEALDPRLSVGQGAGAHGDAEGVARRLGEPGEHLGRNLDQRRQVERVEALAFVETDLRQPGLGERHDL